MADRFRIVYEKLDEAVQQDGSVCVERIAIFSDELDEIRAPPTLGRSG